MHHKLLISILFVSISLAACSPESTSTNNLPPAGDSTTATIDPNDTTLPPAPGQTDGGDDGTMQYIKGEFTIPKAMEVVYGLYDKNIECSRWICKPHEEKSFAGKMSGDGMLYTRAAGAYPIKEGEDKRMLLLTETLAKGKEGWESCHACAPIVGAAMFMEIEGDWFIEALRRDLDEIGSWGEMPPHELVQIGPKAWGARLDYGSTNQGITEGGMELIGMAKDKFEVLATLETNFSNEGMFFEGADNEGAYAYDSKIKFVPGSNPEYWDMVVTTSGTKPIGEDGKIEEFKKVRRFVLSGKSYQEVAQ